MICKLYKTLPIILLISLSDSLSFIHFLQLSFYILSIQQIKRGILLDSVISKKPRTYPLIHALIQP